MPRVSLPQVLWHSKDDKHSDRVYSVDIQPSISLQNLSLHPSFSVPTKPTFSCSPELPSSSSSFSTDLHSSSPSPTSFLSSSWSDGRPTPPVSSASSSSSLHHSSQPNSLSYPGEHTSSRVVLTGSNGVNLMTLPSNHYVTSAGGAGGGGGCLISRKEARAKEKKAAILSSYSRLATAGADEFIHLWKYSFDSGINSLSDSVAVGGGGNYSSSNSSSHSNSNTSNNLAGLSRNFSDLQIQCVARLLGHEREVNAVRWSPDGVYLASGGSDNSTFIWELGLKPDTLPMGYESSSALDYDEWWVRVSLYRCIEAVNSLAWAPSGAQLAIGTEDGRVLVVDCNTGVLATKSARLLEGHSNMVQGIAWDPLDVFLVSQSCDQSVRLWSRRGGGGNAGGNLTNTSGLLVTGAPSAGIGGGVNGSASSSTATAALGGVGGGVGGSLLGGVSVTGGGGGTSTSKGGQQWKLETVVRTARDREGGKEKDQGASGGGGGAGYGVQTFKDEDEDEEASSTFLSSVSPSFSSSKMSSSCMSPGWNHPTCSSSSASLPSSSSSAPGGGGGVSSCSSMTRQQGRSLFYPESSLRSFFRRPDWSPDGTLLVTPAGCQFTSAYHHNNSSLLDHSSSSSTGSSCSSSSLSSSPSSSSSLSYDGTSCSPGGGGTQSMYPASTSIPNEKAVSTTYAFHRRLLTSYGGTPFVTHRSFAGPTIAVRFNPVTFDSLPWPKAGKGGGKEGESRGGPERLPEHMKITRSWLFPPSEKMVHAYKKRLQSSSESMRNPHAEGRGGIAGVLEGGDEPKSIEQGGVRTPGERGAGGGEGCEGEGGEQRPLKRYREGNHHDAVGVGGGGKENQGMTTIGSSTSQQSDSGGGGGRKLEEETSEVSTNLKKVTPSPPSSCLNSLSCSTTSSLLKRKQGEGGATEGSGGDETSSSTTIVVPRFVYAVCTLHGSVLIYDTQCLAGPIAQLHGLHLCPMTDAAWSSDGLLLVCSSSDGYITFVRFEENELGRPIYPSGFFYQQHKGLILSSPSLPQPTSLQSTSGGSYSSSSPLVSTGSSSSLVNRNPASAIAPTTVTSSTSDSHMSTSGNTGAPSVLSSVSSSSIPSLGGGGGRHGEQQCLEGSRRATKENGRSGEGEGGGRGAGEHGDENRNHTPQPEAPKPVRRLVVGNAAKTILLANTTTTSSSRTSNA